MAFHQMIRIAASIFFSGLFLLFLIGVGRILLSFKRPINTSIFLRLILVSIFFFPFLLYFLSGIVNIKFGPPRSFFYLLPIYMLIIFYGLKTMISNERYYYVISMIIISLLLCGGIAGGILWEHENLERQIIKYAAKIDSDLVIISFGRAGYDEWPFEYYAKKYDIQGKVLLLPRIESPFYPGAIEEAYSAIIKKVQNVETFAIIEKLEKGESIKKDRYLLGEESFKIVKKEHYEVEVGPYQFLKKLMRYPLQHIVVYFCKK